MQSPVSVPSQYSTSLLGQLSSALHSSWAAKLSTSFN